MKMLTARHIGGLFCVYPPRIPGDCLGDRCDRDYICRLESVDMKQLLLIGCLGLLMWGCNRIDPEEPLPIYVALENPRVLIDEASGRYSDLGVRDAWVFQREEQIGVFRMPAVIPVLPREGIDSLRIGGGVFETGLSQSRLEYPFWDDDAVSIAGVEPLDTITFSPTFRYFERDTSIIYAFEEYFEGASVGLASQQFTDAYTLLRTSVEAAYTGSFGGRVRFSNNQYLFEATTNLLRLPQSGNNDIWLEVTYQNDIPFTVELVGLAPGSLIEESLPTNIVFASPDEWNTVYVHLNQLARSMPQGSVFKVLFRASSFQEGQQQGREGYLWLDHIRLIHFKPE